ECSDEFDNVSALQGQLQQLFTLHDSGVDQSFIDTLPVFDYKSIIGVKCPFDCAVCLCEFENDDNLSQNVVGDSKPSETGRDDQEIQSCNISDPQVAPARSQSFAKRSLLWLMGRQKNKVFEKDNELESDTEDVLQEFANPNAVIEEVTGCKARIKLVLDIVSGRYKFDQFYPKHNHMLIPKEYKHFTKKQRKMTQAEKMFVVKAATNKIGATRAHNLLSSMKGGYEYVHGTTDDFKNHQRDVNADTKRVQTFYKETKKDDSSRKNVYCQSCNK
ncbi:hypothetical protein Tco_1036151, partial [Tanacetum coccineum]